MAWRRVPGRSARASVLVMVMLGALAAWPRHAAPAQVLPPTDSPADSGPRYIPPPPPSPEDVAAWERLWRGGEGSPEASAPPQPSPERSATASAPAAAPARTRFDDLFDAYAAGDTAVLSREFRSAADFQQYRPDLVTALAQWRSQWSRARAAFALDVALLAFAQRWPDPGRYLAAARDIVVARPEPWGANPDDDRFEQLFHRAAVTMLAVLNAPRDIEMYLDAIDARIATTVEGARASRPTDPRLLLARATARELLTLPILIAGATRSDDPRTWMAGNGEARRRLRDALPPLERAASFDDTRAEAHVRRAFVLHRLGNHDDALASLDAVPADPGPIVGVWRALIRGRVLTAIGRHDEAIAAYEQAAALAPNAQTPAVALAAAMLRVERRADALQWAARARTTRADATDPWTLYWMGDSRFLSEWLSEIRKAVR